MELINKIIGVVGHIDHGKTTLISKLTDYNGDRLPEEKRKGITIDIGFACYQIDEKIKMTIIDMPGHQKYIKNMVVGANSIDYCIVVIACDDGIMPQTREHYEILRVLGIKKGMIVLTKRDLVDDERYRQVFSQCVEYFKDSFLDGAKIITTSMDNVDSWKELDIHLKKEVMDIEGKKLTKTLKIDVDRVFTKKGFGDVVTGTIKSGEITLDTELIHYPTDTRLRIKNIENHKENLYKLVAGNRCALNLVSSGKIDLKRGDVLGEKNRMNTGNILGCLFIPIENNIKIRLQDKIRLNIGTLETQGKIIYVEKVDKDIYIQIQCEKKVTVYYGERGIVRTNTPLKTVGGIKILDMISQKFSKKNRGLLYKLNQDEEIKIIEEYICNLGRFHKKIEIERFLGCENVEKSLEKLKKDGKIFENNNIYIHKTNFNELCEVILQCVEGYHLNNTLKKGMGILELKSKIFNFYKEDRYLVFLDRAFEDAEVILEKDIVFKKSFKVRLTKEEKEIKELIFKKYKLLKYDLKKYQELSVGYGEKFENIHNYMVENSFIIYLGNDYYILNGYFRECAKVLSEYFEKNELLSISEFRKMIGISREMAIILLNKFDVLKITKIVDGKRSLLNKKILDEM